MSTRFFMILLAVLLTVLDQRRSPGDENPPPRPEVQELLKELTETNFNFRRVQLCRKMGNYKEEASIAIPVLKKLRDAADSPKELRAAAELALQQIVVPLTEEQLLEMVASAAKPAAERIEAINELRLRFWKSEAVHNALQEVAAHEKNQAVRDAAVTARDEVKQKLSIARYAAIRNELGKDELFKIVSNSKIVTEQRAALAALVTRFLDKETFGAIKELSASPGEIGKDAKNALAHIELQTRPRQNGVYEIVDKNESLERVETIKPSPFSENARNFPEFTTHKYTREEVLRVKFGAGGNALLEHKVIKTAYYESGKVMQGFPKVLADISTPMKCERDGISLYFSRDGKTFSGQISNSTKLRLNPWAVLSKSESSLPENVVLNFSPTK